MNREVPLFLLLAFIFIVVFAFARLMLFRNQPQDNILENKTIHKTSDAAWVWLSPKELNGKELLEMLDYCNENNISTLYVSIDDYFTLKRIPDTEKRQTETELYVKAIADLARTASKYKIGIQGLAGETEWANPENIQYPTELLQFVIDYNLTHQPDEQLRGLQFDIEFYTHPSFITNEIRHSQDFLTLVEKLIKQVNQTETVSNQFSLGFAIPFWFDHEGTIPQVTWKGDSNYLVYHLLNLLNNLPNSYIAIMDYRNFAQGVDGSIQHVKDELIYARQNTPNVSVFIGQETSKDDPPKTTFYDKTITEYQQQTALLREAYESNPTFKGLAIHDLQHLEELQNK